MRSALASLSSRSLLAAAAIAMSSASIAPSSAPPRPHGPRDLGESFRRTRSRGLGADWRHDPQRLAAAEAKRYRKGEHLRRCADKGAFGPAPFAHT